jgi:serine/threonine protein kinase
MSESPDDAMLTLFQQTFAEFDFEGASMDAEILAGLFGLPVSPPKIGRFEIRERLGSGGMSEVYAAWDPELQRMVAVKLDQIGRRESDELLREARVHARVESPHVLPVYDVGIHGDHVYMAMKIVRGRTLASWQAEHRSLTDIISIYTQAARGLVEIHRSGVIHCDFKPTNVLVDDRDRVWVADFGLARFCPGDVGTTGGTRGYMAPERMFERLSSPASDQFSFCVALFEAVYRASPFPGPPESLEQRLARCEVLFPTDPRAVPKWLTALLERGLQRDPARRFPDMVTLVDELTRDRRSIAKTSVWMAFAIVAVVHLILALHAAPEPAPGMDSIFRAWKDLLQRQFHDSLSRLAG